jgi:hypothetical protein
MNPDHALLPAESSSPVWTENLHAAAQAATRLIRAHFHDSDAWVRLLAFEGGDAASGDRVEVYHFEAAGPMIVGEPQVLVRRDPGGVWRAVLDTWELPTPAITARWGQTQSATEEPHG